MYLKSFEDFVPHKNPPDKSYIILEDEEEPALNGIFELIDCYCPNPDCECYRVTIVIMDRTPKICATIIYGWESEDFYRKRGDDPQVAKQLPHGYLDLENPQSAHAEEFLSHFLLMTQDPNFSNRFKTRYSLFRKQVFSKQSKSKSQKIIPFKSKKQA